MNLSLCLKIVLILWALGASALANPKSSQNCESIKQVPTTINKSGLYCLNQSFTVQYPTHGIVIAADNVSIDFKGHEINLSPDISGQNLFGVYSSGRKNISLINGKITNFSVGLNIGDAGFGVENTIDSMEIMNSGVSGIRTSGGNFVIARNTISNSGLSDDENNLLHSGIEVTSAKCQITKNQIKNIFAKASEVGTGIQLTSVESCIVSENTLVNDFPSSGRNIGLFLQGVKNQQTISVINNQVANFQYGIQIEEQISADVVGNQVSLVNCLPYEYAKTDLYSENRIGGFESLFQAITQPCTDDISLQKELAKQGVVDAFYRLGQIYKTPYTFDLAYAWFFVAAQLGHKEAKRLEQVLASSQSSLRDKATPLIDQIKSEYTVK